MRDQIIDRLLASPEGQAIEQELRAETLDRRAAARATIKKTRRESEKRAAELEAACFTLAAAKQSCREAVREAVAAEAARRKAIHAGLAAISAAEDFLRETAAATVTEALFAVREEEQRLGRAGAVDARHLAHRQALTLQEEELTTLLAEDDGLPDRIAEIAGRVEPRTRRGEAILRLGACLPRMTFMINDAIPEQEQLLHDAIARLRAVDPLGRDAAKEIAEIMRPLEPLLRPRPEPARA